mmetsp:Transcript_30435/g.40200  ORF Transcript_30435/g.40200 Transcript_30435/m.40200 type:complete len:82 (+) Transcript_30435:145-390(+)
MRSIVEIFREQKYHSCSKRFEHIHSNPNFISFQMKSVFSSICSYIFEDQRKHALVHKKSLCGIVGICLHGWINIMSVRRFD